MTENELDMSPYLVPQRTRVGEHQLQRIYAYLGSTSTLRRLTSVQYNEVTTALRNGVTVGEVENGIGEAVFWNGTDFEVLPVKHAHSSGRGRIAIALHDVDSSHGHIVVGQNLAMWLYYPIDPRIEKRDIVGAVEAYPNATNTGWLFRHTQEGTHHDYELHLLAAIDGVAQPYIRGYLADSFNSNEGIAERGKNGFVKLSTFYGEVVGEARSIARGVYLGERHQKAHPPEGWLDRDITAAVEKVEADWKENHPTNLKAIASRVKLIKDSLTMPSVETRWDRAARLAAEAEAAASEASDGDAASD